MHNYVNSKRPGHVDRAVDLRTDDLSADDLGAGQTRADA